MTGLVWFIAIALVSVFPMLALVSSYSDASVFDNLGVVSKGRSVSDNSIEQFTKLKPNSDGITISDNSVFDNLDTVSNGRHVSDNSISQFTKLK